LARISKVHDLFNLHCFKDGPVDSSKASVEVGTEASKVITSRLNARLLKVVRWMNEGTSKVLTRQEKTAS